MPNKIHDFFNQCLPIICSNWSMFYSQLTHLREIFQKTVYPENFIDRRFGLFLNRTYILKEKVPTVDKKPRRFIFLYLGTLHCKLGPNCQSSSESHLTVVNYRLFSKIKMKSVTISASKPLFPKFFHQVCFISFSVDYPTNLVTENLLDILL